MTRKVMMIAALIAVLAAVSLVAAQAAMPGTGWTTGMQFQNVGDGNAAVRLYLYTPQGGTIDCGQQNAPPGGSVNYLIESSCLLSGVFGGSAVVESNQPLQGIVHINNASIGQAGGIYNATTQEEIATTLLFPLVKHNHSGRTTSFHIQNAGGGAISLTATFRVNGVTYTKSFSGVPAGAMVVVSPADAGVPAGNGQVGSLTVTGSGPMAGTSLEHQHAAAVAQNLQASKAFTTADFANKVYCPLFRNAHSHGKQTTGAQVQNVGNSAQTVSLSYTPRDGGDPIIRSATVQPGASATFYAPQIGIPAGSVGSVTISGQGDIVAVVNDQGIDRGQQRATTYACFPAHRATNRVVLPLYKEYWVGNMTGIQVQNVAGNGTAANIQITYMATNNNNRVTLAPAAAVADGGSVTFFGISDRISPAGFAVISGSPEAMDSTFGSVIIESNTPIVAMVNESGFGPNARNQDSKNYEGFNE